MVRNLNVAQMLFAATFVALGVIGLVGGDFAPAWQPVPRTVPEREALAYLCGFISLASGMGLLWPRTAAAAARVLLGSLLLWFLLFRVPVLFRAPIVEVSWEGCGESAVVVSGAWALYAWLASDWDRQRLGFAVGEAGVRLARVVFGLALIPLGLAHFVYLKQTAALVPAWLPSHQVWASFTGFTYIAAGVAMLGHVLARFAAALSALQMGAFTLLVWVPILVTGPRGPFQWSEALVSWSLTASALVVADSYRRWSAAPTGPTPLRARQESRLPFRL